VADDSEEMVRPFWVPAPGDMVEVIAPVGRRMVTVFAVDRPVVFSVA
jgi:hypothetical protein